MLLVLTIKPGGPAGPKGLIVRGALRAKRLLTNKGPCGPLDNTNIQGPAGPGGQVTVNKGGQGKLL